MIQVTICARISIYLARHSQVCVQVSADCAEGTNLKWLDGEDSLQHEQHAPFHSAHRQGIQGLYDKKGLQSESTIRPLVAFISPSTDLCESCDMADLKLTHMMSRSTKI